MCLEINFRECLKLYTKSCTLFRSFLYSAYKQYYFNLKWKKKKKLGQLTQCHLCVHLNVHFDLPMTTCTESWVSLAVRAHMCRLCVDLTPHTDSRTSFTESKSTPHGTPSDETSTFSWFFNHLGIYICRPINHLPSMSILKMSFRMVNVVPSTNNENRKVQIRSAFLHSGCWFGERNKYINRIQKCKYVMH